MLSPTAIANVHAHNIHARAICFLGCSQHVSRRGRTFDAMPHHDSSTLSPIRLPTATRQHLRVFFHLEHTYFIVGQIARTKPARPKISCERLQIAVPDHARGTEGS